MNITYRLRKTILESCYGESICAQFQLLICTKYCGFQLCQYSYIPKIFMIECVRNNKKRSDEENKINHVIFIPKCEAIFCALRDEINIVFIYMNIPYLLPSSAMSQSVLGPPDHESLILLYWSHFKSAIEHIYIKIKREFRPCFYGLHGGWHRETGLSPPVKYFYRPFEGGTSFVDHLCYFCLVFVMLSRVCFRCLVVTCWERADLLAVLFDV